MTGQEFRDLRTSLGMTQADVAELCDVSRQAVIKWERLGPTREPGLLLFAMSLLDPTGRAAVWAKAREMAK